MAARSGRKWRARGRLERSFIALAWFAAAGGVGAAALALAYRRPQKHALRDLCIARGAGGALVEEPACCSAAIVRIAGVVNVAAFAPRAA